MADVLNRLLAGFAVAGAAALSGCGGVADEVQADLAANTPLSIVGLTGLPGYTVGTPQTYSLTVRDPDGVAVNLVQTPEALSWGETQQR